MNTHDPRLLAVDLERARARVPDLLRYWSGTLPESVIAAALAAGPRPSAGGAGATAVVPLHGLILRRPGLIEELFGAASLDRFMAAMREAVANPDVTAIVIDVDSPGGEVDGITEAAAELRAMRGVKPVIAICDTMAASAAYWLASQASEVVVTPSGGVGAIGVYMVYDDISGLLEQEGVKRTVLSAGKFKEASVGGQPLSDAARDQFQALIDAHYAAFVGDVAKGRNVPASKVRGGYGEGLFLSASAAKAEGMVDRVAPLADVLRSPALRGGARAEGAAAIVAETDPQDPEPDPEPTADPADLELYRRRAVAHLR